MTSTQLQRRVETSTTFLFVPGSRPDRFDKAERSGTDVVVVDLEDAVAPKDKPHARAASAEWLDKHAAVVRCNGIDTEWHTADLGMLSTAGGLAGVILPKAETVDGVREVVSALHGVPVVALIESARGVLASPDIAAIPGVARLAFGSLDYLLDLGCVESSVDEQPLAFPRWTISVASAAAGLRGPIDGVYTDLADPTGLAASCQRSLATRLRWETLRPPRPGRDRPLGLHTF